MTRAIVVVLAITMGVAEAHDLRPGVLSLTELSPGEYALRFVPPIDSRGEPTRVSIVLPPGCTQTRVDHVQCAGSITGELGVAGMHGKAMKALVILRRLSGERGEWMIDSNAPRIVVDRAPPVGMLPWIRLGIEHIFGGLDHLAFVIGLLLVLDLAIGRRLLVTITSFTLAHSLTLALAVLGVVHVHAVPVEACIAASVLLVAREATHREPRKRAVGWLPSPDTCNPARYSWESRPR